MTWVTQYWDRPSWQVDNAGFTLRISGVAKVNLRGVLQRVWGRGGGGGRWRRLSGGGWWGSGCQHTHDILVTGGIRAISQLQVTHLLIQHPDPVDLIDLERNAVIDEKIISVFRKIAESKLSHNIQTTYSFNVSDAVVEAVVGLEVRVASVPLWVNVSFGPRVSQEIMRLSGADADGTSCGWKQHTDLSLF